MAGIKFAKKEFEKYIRLTKEVEEKISLFGTHFEGSDENEIEIEVNPNRPDLYSLHGFIRAFQAFLGKKSGLKNYKVSKPEKDFEVKIDPSVKEVRPFTACAIVKNLKFDDDKIKEIIDIQEKLHTTLGRNRKKIAIGIYPLEEIKLPIKFEARAPKDIKFQPLESPREMNGLQILQQHPTGRDYAHLLDGKDKFPIFIDSNKEILSMPPIINSHKTGKVSESTKDIFIECSGFDFEILNKTLNILVTMLAEMGGEIYQMNLIYGKDKRITPSLEPEKVKISLDNVNKILGLDLKEAEIKNCLEKMGYNYNKDRIVEIPAWRTDIMHEADLIEDIAIAYGYENFVPEIPKISTIGEIDKREILKEKIANILIGLGITETLTYHLNTAEELKKFNKKPLIEVEDSKTEYKYLRADLLSQSLNVLSQNIDSSYPQRIFETGVVFSRDSTGKSETGIKEVEKLSIALVSPTSGFTEIKQTLDYLMRMLNIEYRLETANNNHFIDGRCAKIVVKDRAVGFLGEIAPQLISSLKIKMPIAGLELDLEEL
jgi:phenylalanyl-tRNA synthetase beta chain